MRVSKIVATCASACIALAALTGCSQNDTDDKETNSNAGASTACEYDTESNAAKKVDLPQSSPRSAEMLTIATSHGDIAVKLDAKNAPCTVNSFVSLAEQGYFDDTQCHRLVPGFVLQCGDPSATGMGGPGYSFDDELTGDETYTTGTVAMANSGPDTNGSQFFIVLADVALPPDYTVFGTVDAAGMKVAHAIEAAGVEAGSEKPIKAVTINSMS
ncbi:MAG: peptidylprolyl isomerase [Aeromicrobium sp.]|nr:MAG: peptidylprolyl isomerase [Aeromicrobium sp.]